MHKYKVGDIVYHCNEEGKYKCEIINLWNLIYQLKYPTYQIKLLEHVPKYNCLVKMIVPECMLENIK